MIHLFYAPAQRNTASDIAHRLCETGFARLTGQTGRLCKDEGGRPYFQPPALYVSISHTASLALAALADVPVGVDAEQPRRIGERLIARCLAPEEQAALRTAADPQALFLRLWTLKEAYVKFTGEGIRRFPNHLCFTLHGPLAHLAGSTLWFRTLKLGDATVSVCAGAPQQIVTEGQLSVF